MQLAVSLSCPTPRLQNLLQIIPAILMRRLMVMQLLLEVGYLGRSLRTLTGETLVDSINRDIDEPIPPDQLLHFTQSIQHASIRGLKSIECSWWAMEGGHLHLPNAFVHSCLGGYFRQLFRC